MQNVEIGVVCGLEITQGHWQSPFDRVHTTSYSTLIENVHISSTVLKL